MQREAIDPPTTTPGSTMSTVAERPLRGRVSYRAIVAGTLIALMTYMVLMLLGAAIGLSAFEPEADVAQGVGIGLAIWTIVALAASTYLGAWTASCVARTPLRRDGAFHGVVTWALASLIGLLLVGNTLGAVMTRTLGIAGQSIPTLVQSPQALGAPTPTRIEEQLPSRQEVAQTGAQVAQGAAIGLWGLFIAYALSLGAACIGGMAGAKSEAKVLGIPHAVRARALRPGETTWTPTTPTGPTVPTPG